MPVSNGLRRLLRIRDLEEEQQRLALESALGELRSLEHALLAAQSRSRSGREQIARSAGSDDAAERLAGLVEAGAGERRAIALQPRIVCAQAQAAKLRQQFLLKRVERRQAETLVRETEAQDAVEVRRQGQRNLDEWFRTRAWTSGCEGSDRRAGEKLEMRAGKESEEVPEEGIEFPS